MKKVTNVLNRYDKIWSLSDFVLNHVANRWTEKEPPFHISVH